jgi:hypothetical protein
LLNNISPEGHSLYTFFEREDGYWFKPIEKLISDGKKFLKQGGSDLIFYYDNLRNQDGAAVKFRNILSYSILKKDGISGDVLSQSRNLNPDTGEINLPHEKLPISQEIYFPNPIEEEETPNSIQDEDIYETQAADAVSVEDEQPQDQSLIDEIFEDSDNLASPHKRTGKFVGKPKNWGMRFPPIKL